MADLFIRAIPLDLTKALLQRVDELQALIVALKAVPHVSPGEGARQLAAGDYHLSWCRDRDKAHGDMTSATQFDRCQVSQSQEQIRDPGRHRQSALLCYREEPELSDRVVFVLSLFEQQMLL